jgi:hypothetical protein
MIGLRLSCDQAGAMASTNPSTIVTSVLIGRAPSEIENWHVLISALNKDAASPNA